MQLCALQMMSRLGSRNRNVGALLPLKCMGKRSVLKRLPLSRNVVLFEKLYTVLKYENMAF